VGPVNASIHAGADAFWTHTADFSIPPGAVHAVDISCGITGGGQARRRGGGARGVFMMEVRPLTVAAQAGMVDGQIEVVIDGGVAPYTVVFGQKSVQTSSLRLTLSTAGDWTTVQVVDSQGNTASATTGQRTRVFDVVDVTLVSTRGCGDRTSATVFVALSGLATDVRLGAWNEGEGEQAIASCGDDRLKPAPDQRLLLPSPGTWRVAACGAGRVFVRPSGMVTKVVARDQSWRAEVVSHGVVCGNQAVINILGVVHGDLRGRIDALRQTTGLAMYENRVEIASPSPGIMHMTLFDDWACEVPVVLEFSPGVCSAKDDEVKRAAAMDRRTGEGDYAFASGAPAAAESPSPSKSHSHNATRNETHSASASATESPLPYNGSNGLDGVSMVLILLPIGVIGLLLIMFFVSWRMRT